MTHDEYMDLAHANWQPICDSVESLCDVDAVAASRLELVRDTITKQERIMARDFDRMIELAEATRDTATVKQLQQRWPKYQQKLLWALYKHIETIEGWQREQHIIRHNMRGFYGPNSPHRDPKLEANCPGLRQRQLAFVRSKWTDPMSSLQQALDELRIT